MKRLTKKIKNTYCGYEVKNATYKQLFDLESNKQIENYVNCDLSIAIDKLGRLEDIEEELECPLEVIGKAIINNCFYDGERYRETNIGYVDDGNERGFVISVNEWEDDHTMFLKDHKKTWWLNKDKSE